MESATYAWRLIAYSSGITVAGSCIIWFDVIWNALFKTKISILNNRSFLVASLGLSGGVLLTTALHSLLANAVNYFKDGGFPKKRANQLLLIAVVTGVIICSLVNFIIHSVTSRSIVHCAHDGGHHHDDGAASDDENGHHSHVHYHEDEEATPHSHHNHSHENITEPNEYTPLTGSGYGPAPIRQFISESISTPRLHTKRSLIDRLQKVPSQGECRGFDSLYQCAAEIHMAHHPDDPNLDVVPNVYLEGTEHPTHDHREREALHHHHVVPHGSQLLSIGLQTAFAITVHKLPEGFLLFATGREDKRVGLHVFIALAVHNFFEGFTIATPLYFALKNRSLAVLCAAVLGGGAQPLGALFAQLSFRDKLDKSHFVRFGYLIGSTAGFMTIISLQMLCTAVSYGGAPQTVVLWTITGVIISLGTNCL